MPVVASDMTSAVFDMLSVPLGLCGLFVICVVAVAAKRESVRRHDKKAREDD